MHWEESELKDYKKGFKILKKEVKESSIVYLDNGATTQKTY